MPPGKALRWGADTLVAGAQRYRPLYVLDSRPIITGEYLTDAQPNQDPDRGQRRRVHAEQRGRPPLPNETGEAHAGLHGDRARRARHGRPPVHPERHRHARADHAGRRHAAGGAGPRARAARRRAAGAAQGRRGAQDRREPRPGLDPQGHARAGSFGARARRDDHGRATTGSPACSRCSASRSTCVYTLAILAGFDAALTLPGLAGFVLSIGIAVDANVLIFERIREELDRGKTVRLAIDEGFRHALERDRRHAA